MRDRVDPSGETGKNCDPNTRERIRHLSCPAQPCGSRRPCADNCDGEGSIGAKRSDIEEERRQVVDRPKVQWIVLVENGREVQAGLAPPSHVPLHLGRIWRTLVAKNTN